jgi:hypothetical protein
VKKYWIVESDEANGIKKYLEADDKAEICNNYDIFSLLRLKTNAPILKACYKTWFSYN